MSDDEIKKLLKDIVWAVVEKNYNVDRGDPRVLTYKHIAMNHNPIDEIAVGVFQAFQQLAQQLVSEPEPELEHEEEYDFIHNYDWGGDD